MLRNIKARVKSTKDKTFPYVVYFSATEVKEYKVARFAFAEDAELFARFCESGISRGNMDALIVANRI